VDEEVPREAKRVYLRSRLDSLSASIGEEVEHFEALNRELAVLEQRAPDALDERVRKVIERSIQPDYIRRRRRERTTAAALLGLVPLSLSPVPPLYAFAEASTVLFNPADAYTSDLVASVVVVGLASGGLLWLVAQQLLRRRDMLPPRWALVALGVALLAFVATLAHGVDEWNLGNPSAGEPQIPLASSRRIKHSPKYRDDERVSCQPAGTRARDPHRFRA
jgi:hypothetical protein